MERRVGGWLRDRPDSRDYIAKLKRASGVDVSNIDLRKNGFLPNIYNQGKTQACTGCSISAALEYGRRKEKLSDFAPSKLFIYYNERTYSNTVSSDDGAAIRDGMKSLQDFGAASEDIWPFLEDKVCEKPPEVVYTSAKPNIIKQYSRLLTSLKDVQAALSKELPIVFGLSCFENFDIPLTRETGAISMPQGKHVGDHCMLIVGLKKTTVIIRNSWGIDWGDDGYCYIPYDYIFNDAWSGDFWIIDVA